MVSVRAAEPGETGRIIDLLDDLFPNDPIRPPDEEFAERAEQRHPYLFVAMADNGVAGFVILRDRPLRLWTSVDFVGVDPAHQGKGVGTALTRHALLTAHRPLVRLFVRPSNIRAHALYGRCGFRSAGRRKANYPDGEDAIIMMARSARFSLFPAQSEHDEADRISA